MAIKKWLEESQPKEMRRRSKSALEIHLIFDELAKVTFVTVCRGLSLYVFPPEVEAPQKE